MTVSRIHVALAIVCLLHAAGAAAEDTPLNTSAADGEVVCGLGYVMHVAGDQYRILVRTEEGGDVVVAARAGEVIVPESVLGREAEIEGKVHRQEDGEMILEFLSVTKLLPSRFKFSVEAIEQAKVTARRESLRRRDLSRRRPEGLADLESETAIRGAIVQSMQELGDGDRKRQEHALAKLRYLGDPAFDEIVAGLKSERVAARFWSAVLLQNHVMEGIEPLSESARTEEVASVRAAAVQALGNTFNPKAVPALIDALQDKDFAVVLAAIYGLRSIGDQRGIMPLVDFSTPVDQASQLQQRAADVCAELSRREHLNRWPPELLELRQLTIDARGLAGESFGMTEHDRLLEHIDHPAWLVSSNCLVALAELHVESAVPAIMERKRVAGDANIVLADIATEEAVDHLLGGLQSRNPTVRDRALHGITYGGGRWTIPLLVELLDDQSLRTVHTEERPIGLAGSAEWPDDHRAHTALFLRLYEAGFKGERVNLASGREFDIDSEISRLKAWWERHGSAFLQEEDVPDPKVTSPSYDR